MEDLSYVSTVLGLYCAEIIFGDLATMAMKEWPVMHLDILIQVFWVERQCTDSYMTL